ncbi:putative quinol monooxygenase [Saprospira grandis]|uniref:putative quinol monooxygenase n=1 Tax=Saprospira grandis TaxID=1008 RepID=UPI0022DDD7D1|nr:putative quinol monooxygenase [Saprospira grandis]WBM74831.1 antibiotic biosynthesis monooxygenase [Saprospira grandis]
MKEQKLTIVAQLEVKAEKVEFIKEELFKLVKATRLEEGCIVYDLNQDFKDPNSFLIYELWESRALWEQHMQSEHLLAYREAAADALVQFSVQEMQGLEP